jgi:hypothetical protein
MSPLIRFKKLLSSLHKNEELGEEPQNEGRDKNEMKFCCSRQERLVMAGPWSSFPTQNNAILAIFSRHLSSR